MRDPEPTQQTAIRYSAQTRTVQDLINLYEDGKLNLNPGFQRESVWSDRDRAKLIDSILRGYPIPAIFLYERHADGSLVYDVIDGKQRIEAIFRFMGMMRGKSFSTKTVLDDSSVEELVSWSALKRRQAQHKLEGYQLQVIFVEGGLSQIIDLFVRINSTGRALTRQEQRHAKYYRSPFLKKASQLAERFRNTFIDNRVFSANQISRMKHIELVSELILSVYYGEPLHKKEALDQAMSDRALPARSLQGAYQETRRALYRTLRIFPNLRQTRFRQVSDFYTLVLVIWRLDREGCILTSAKRNRIAASMLGEFGAGVDQLRHLQKRLERLPEEMDVYRAYLQTVLEGTDTARNRKAREKILIGLFGSLFERKDPWRLFTPEQRRIVWQASKNKKCSICGSPVSWEDFTVDHIRPYARGGRTVSFNAALAHRTCNSSKKDRWRRGRQ